jgi:hypothetical protein
MATQQKSQQELQEFSDEHLFYEIWMLCEMADRVLNGKYPDQVAKNAYIESFVIHSRNVLDFLYNVGNRPDDVHASDFEDNVPWNPPLKDAVLSAWYPTRMNKHLAHMTYKRLTVPEADRNWPVKDIFPSVRVVLNEFFNWVPAKNIGPRFQSEIQRIRNQQANTQGSHNVPPTTGGGISSVNPGTSVS